jgi:hypothetical protein
VRLRVQADLGSVKRLAALLLQRDPKVRHELSTETMRELLQRVRNGRINPLLSGSESSALAFAADGMSVLPFRRYPLKLEHDTYFSSTETVRCCAPPQSTPPPVSPLPLPSSPSPSPPPPSPPPPSLRHQPHRRRSALPPSPPLSLARCQHPLLHYCLHATTHLYRRLRHRRLLAAVASSHAQR